MKTNLNIAYLNGAEGMIRRGASSSGSGSGEASTIEYLDVSNQSSVMNLFVKSIAYICKAYIDEKYFIAPLSLFSSNDIAIVAAAVIPSMKIIIDSGEYTLAELASQFGLSQEQLDAIPRITKEEFYSLE